MTDEKKINLEETKAAAGGGLASASVDYDRCPMCDTPTPVVGGPCTCPSCGHSWTAGSH